MKVLTKLAPRADADERAPNTYLRAFTELHAQLGVTLDDLRDHNFWMRAPSELWRTYARRDEFIARYGFAVPDDEALGAIAAYSPGGVIEIGAGTGYWAHLLNGRFGVPVVAYDTHPITPDGKSGNTYFDRRGTHESFYEVRKGDHTVLALFPDATLLLCWPPYDTPMAAECLAAYKGDTVAYVGEGDGGCTGDEEFHDRLNYEWTEHEDIAIPQWHGIHDRLRIYKRGPETRVANALAAGVCDCEDWSRHPCAVCWHAGKRVSAKYEAANKEE